MAKVPNGIETLRKISIALGRVHERYRRHTTDERTTTYSERERELTVAEKKCKRFCRVINKEMATKEQRRCFLVA